MKKLSLIILSLLILSSCADDRTIDGITYRPYGLFNEDDCKNDSIHYEVPTRVIVSTVIFSETIIVPLYNLGFNLYEPTCTKSKMKKGEKCKKD
jgi:hypothetical protein